MMVRGWGSEYFQNDDVMHEQLLKLKWQAKARFAFFLLHSLETETDEETHRCF